MSKYEPGKRHWLKVKCTQLYLVKMAHVWVYDR